MKSNDKQVSVVIPTKNRAEELRVAVQSVLKQTIQPEVIVLDDASSDGTADMMEKEFPEVSFVRSEKPIGATAQRNLGTKLAQNSIVVSIDDDIEFVNSNTIEQTLNLFDYPRVAVVTIPFINIKVSPKVFQQASGGDEILVAFAFGGGGYAVRKDIFLNLNGYREMLYMEGEESDFSIRMLDRGYVVRLGGAAPILHFSSPKRERIGVAPSREFPSRISFSTR